MKQRSEKPELFVECEKFVEKKKKNPLHLQPLDKDYELSEDIELKDKINHESYYLVKHPEVRVQFESIFDTTIETVDSYYICNGCGHIYWEGPHWQNIETRFSHVLTNFEIEKEKELVLNK